MFILFYHLFIIFKSYTYSYIHDIIFFLHGLHKCVIQISRLPNRHTSRSGQVSDTSRHHAGVGHLLTTTFFRRSRDARRKSDYPKEISGNRPIKGFREAFNSRQMNNCLIKFLILLQINLVKLSHIKKPWGYPVLQLQSLSCLRGRGWHG